MRLPLLLAVWACLAIAIAGAAIHDRRTRVARARADLCATIDGRAAAVATRLEAIALAWRADPTAAGALLDGDAERIRDRLREARRFVGADRLGVADLDGVGAWSVAGGDPVPASRATALRRPLDVHGRRFELLATLGWADALVGADASSGTSCAGSGDLRWEVEPPPVRGVPLWLVAGLVAAHAARAPLRRIQRTVDAVRAGGADYAHTAPEDGVDEVAVAFSELRRAHDAQTERARQAERVSAWRDVARHVAHEVKNPLVPIRLTVENLRRARERAPERLDALLEQGTRTILEEVEQLDRLVASFAEFARLPAPDPRPCDLVERVEATLDLFAADGALEVRRDLPDTAPIVGDPEQLSRALKNVVKNAREAAGDGPTRIDVSLERDGARWVLGVRDYGPGLAADAREAVFHEGFTTKKTGSGLGLAISRRIVAEHHGSIRLESPADGGLRVRIDLPARPES